MRDDARIYGVPGLIKNKATRALLQRADDVSYVKVPCGQRQSAEPNDEAIISEMQARVGSPGRECIALLTGDKSFADTFLQLMSEEKTFLVLIPSRSFTVVDFYCQQGISVVTLTSPDERSTKVRAILHPDGNGTVKLEDAFDLAAHRAQCEGMYDSWEQLLKGQGCPALFSSSGGYTIQRIAKFWFVNGLGSVPVFPALLAIDALDKEIRRQPRSWTSDAEGFAYVLPVSASGTITKSGREKYGSLLGRTIFRGGGRFILRDSRHLVTQALRKLGYLDDKWNNDLTEALNCFWNASTNKHKLRKLGIFVDPIDTTCDATAKLRMALLSDRTNGIWQRGGTCTPSVVRILRYKMYKKLLSMDSADPPLDEVWSGMRPFAQIYQLPEFKTFNALAAHIVAHSNDSHPHKRGNVVIQEWLCNLIWLLASDFCQEGLLYATDMARHLPPLATHVQ